MPEGESLARANALLNTLRGVTYTGMTVWAQLHTGAPGAAGTANASANTTRQQVSFAAPTTASGIQQIVSALLTWANWSTGTETITHVSLWDAQTNGNFQRSLQGTVSKQMTNGDTLNSTITLTLGPIAS